jgi:hypothetical protein
LDGADLSCDDCEESDAEQVRMTGSDQHVPSVCAVGLAAHGIHESAAKGFAVRALQARLHSARAPSWVSYCSPELRAAMGVQVSCIAGSPDTTSNSNAEGANNSVGNSVVGRVWELSQCAVGSRTVQSAVETAADDNARAQFAIELHGHVWEALECPHANFVLQKCISTLPSHLLQFIIDEIMSENHGAITAAQGRFGCRIIQRLLENCMPEQLQDLVDAIISDAKSLAHHAFGNYVLQHILDYGVHENMYRLLHFVEQEAQELSFDPYAASVVVKALVVAPTEHVAVIVRALLSKSDQLARMAMSRHGGLVVQAVLEQAQEGDRKDAVNQLRLQMSVLRSSKCSRTKQLLRTVTEFESAHAPSTAPNLSRIASSPIRFC